MKRWRICSAGVALGLSLAACGPAAPEDGTGSGAGSSSGRPVTSGATASGPMTRPADSTGSTTAAGTSSSSSSTGAPLACADNPAAMVPDPPPGCVHAYLDGPDGQADLSRPSGYWICNGPSGPVYRVAAVPCNCEVFFPPCADGTPDDCNGRACEPGQSCIGFSSGFCTCLSQCNQDSDCGPGQACLCASGDPDSIELSATNRCVPADCQDDDGCAGELSCKVSNGDCGPVESIRCTTPADDCVGDDDCRSTFCRWDEVEELWTCDPGAICE